MVQDAVQNKTAKDSNAGQECKTESRTAMRDIDAAVRGRDAPQHLMDSISQQHSKALA